MKTFNDIMDNTNIDPEDDLFMDFGPVFDNSGKRLNYKIQTQSFPDSHILGNYLRKNSISDVVCFLSVYLIFIYRLTGAKYITILLTIGSDRIKLPFKVCIENSFTIEELIKCIEDKFADICENIEKYGSFDHVTSLGAEKENKIIIGFTENFTQRLNLLESIKLSDNMPISLNFVYNKDGDNYNYSLQYDSGIFSESTIKGWLENIQKIISTALLNSEICIGNFDFLSDGETELLKALNNTGIPYDNNICLHEKLIYQAEKTPDNIALFSGSASMSYHELNQYSNAVANLLTDKGVMIGDRVSVCLERGFDLIIAIFGVLKAGAVYLPVSSEYPVTRIREIFDDARPKFVLSSQSTLINLPVESQIIDIELFLASKIDHNYNYHDLKISSKELAYIIYTSGTTGKPKGVMIEHHSVINRISWMQKSYTLTSDDVLMQKTPLTFDVSIWELFWWSFAGAGLVLLEPGGEKNPDSILQAIDKYNVTTIHFVPSMFNVLLMYMEHTLSAINISSLKTIFCSGESLSQNLVSRFYKFASKIDSKTHIVNLYGPTEATVDVSYFNCPRSNMKLIPLGKPIDNTELYIVNEYYQPQPVNIPGELIICGVNLARGYFNNKILTREKFVNINILGNEKLAYRTGDLAYWGEDGNIYFMGRMDNQVKLRGMRIELEEIEAKTLLFPGIGYCVVLLINKDSDGSFLAAFYQKKSIFDSVDPKEIKNFLKCHLPEYEVPSVLREIDEIPLNINGKVDRKALALILTDLPFCSISNSTTYFEKKISVIWKNLLKNNNFDLNSNFFDVGGNSLILVRLLILLKNDLNKELDVLTVLHYPTINSLAKYLSDNSLKKF